MWSVFNEEDEKNIEWNLQRDPDLFKDILKETNDYNRKNHIKGFKIVKKVHLCKEHFSVDNNLLTTAI